MTLSEYFDTTKGTGILSTSNSDGEVDVAIYAHPHFLDEQKIAFIMTDRLSHENTRSNPNAAYLFIEEGHGYKGKRLYLKKIEEETDAAKIAALRTRPLSAKSESMGETRYLVSFRIEKIRPLIGD